MNFNKYKLLIFLLIFAPAWAFITNATYLEPLLNDNEYNQFVALDDNLNIDFGSGSLSGLVKHEESNIYNVNINNNDNYTLLNYNYYSVSALEPLKRKTDYTLTLRVYLYDVNYQDIDYGMNFNFALVSAYSSSRTVRVEKQVSLNDFYLYQGSGYTKYLSYQDYVVEFTSGNYVINGFRIGKFTSNYSLGGLYNANFGFEVMINKGHTSLTENLNSMPFYSSNDMPFNFLDVELINKFGYDIYRQLKFDTVLSFFSSFLEYIKVLQTGINVLLKIVDVGIFESLFGLGYRIVDTIKGWIFK